MLTHRPGMTRVETGFCHDHHRSPQSADRPHGRQRRRLRPRAPCGRHPGRPRQRDRRPQRAAGDRDRQPRRRLRDAGSDLRQAPRAYADLRAGVRPVLPRRRRLEAHAGFGAAAGPRQEEAAAGVAPRPGGAGPALDARRSPAGPGAGTAAVGLRQGDPAEKGFCADERGRDLRGHPRHCQHEAAAGGTAHPPLPARRQGPAARHAPHHCAAVCAPAARSSTSESSAGSTSRRRSWRCSIYRDR